VKAGKTPEGWEKQPAKNDQKDKDARWTKKNDESFYGYKNHLGVDKAHKLIRKWDATDASVHDSQKLDAVLDLSNTGKGVWADSAYRKQPAKNAQMDKDACWTKENDESFYGYKNHLGVDKAHKLIRKWDATDSCVHDSQKLDAVLDLSN